MNASARRILVTDPPVTRSARLKGTTQAAKSQSERKTLPGGGGVPAAKFSVFVAADNRMLREALAHMLTRKSNVEVTGLESDAPLQAECVAQTNADVLLLTSRGTLNDDLLMIQYI